MCIHTYVDNHTHTRVCVCLCVHRYLERCLLYIANVSKIMHLMKVMCFDFILHLCNNFLVCNNSITVYLLVTSLTEAK